MAVSIGIFFPEHASKPELAARGINRGVVWGANNFAINEFVAVGGKAWISLEDVFRDGNGNPRYDQGLLDFLVNATKTNPGVELYLHKDEPDLAGYPLDWYQQAYARMKQLAPNIPVAAVIRYPFRTSNPNGRIYVGPQDIIMNDPYLYPFGPATQVGDETAATVAVAGGRPVWPVIQVHSTGNSPDPLREYPPVSEVIGCGVSAFQNGATGISMYAYWGDLGPIGGDLPQFNAPVWNAMATITNEFRLAAREGDTDPGGGGGSGGTPHTVLKITQSRGLGPMKRYGSFSSRPLSGSAGVGPRTGARLVGGGIGGRLVG